MTVAQPILIATMLVTNNLSDEELRALYAIALSGKPLDEEVFAQLCNHHEGYLSRFRTIGTLFPKTNEHYMHRHTLEALEIIVEERLEGNPL